MYAQPLNFSGEIQASMKKCFIAIALLSLVTIFFAACSGSSTNSGPNSPNTAHLSDTDFVQSSITIKKGERVTLVDDSAAVHIIENGTWDSNGTPKPAVEPGAPSVQVQFNGNDTQTIGPFNTAGTYKLYCTIHTGMNLTVIVQ